MTAAVVEVERVLTEDGQPPVLGHRRLAVVGVHEVDHRMPEQVVARVAERLLPGAVDRREDTREIGSRDQVEREVPVRRELALELPAAVDERARRARRP